MRPCGACSVPTIVGGSEGGNDAEGRKRTRGAGRVEDWIVGTAFRGRCERVSRCTLPLRGRVAGFCALWSRASVVRWVSVGIRPSPSPAPVRAREARDAIDKVYGPDRRETRLAGHYGSRQRREIHSKTAPTHSLPRTRPAGKTPSTRSNGVTPWNRMHTPNGRATGARCRAAPCARGVRADLAYQNRNRVSNS